LLPRRSALYCLKPAVGTGYAQSLRGMPSLGVRSGVDTCEGLRDAWAYGHMPQDRGSQHQRFVHGTRVHTRQDSCFDAGIRRTIGTRGGAGIRWFPRFTSRIGVRLPFDASKTSGMRGPNDARGLFGVRRSHGTCRGTGVRKVNDTRSLQGVHLKCGACFSVRVRLRYESRSSGGVGHATGKKAIRP